MTAKVGYEHANYGTAVTGARRKMQDRFIFPYSLLREQDTSVGVPIVVLYSNRVSDALRKELMVFSEKFGRLIKEFSQQQPKVHSAWINIDHDHKEIKLLTVVDEIDFDLETAIFEGPYNAIPSFQSDYYIDFSVTCNCDDSIPAEVAENYKELFRRE